MNIVEWLIYRTKWSDKSRIRRFYAENRKGTVSSGRNLRNCNYSDFRSYSCKRCSADSRTPNQYLSDGEKLDLCIDVAIQKPNGLQIILIDGVEKMSTKMRTDLYQKCKDKGLQFIATRTTDEEDLTVIEL